MQLRCSEVFNSGFISNFLINITVKRLKLVSILFDKDRAYNANDAMFVY